MKLGRIMLTLFTISIIAVGTIGFSTLAFANQNISQSEQSNSNPDIIPGKYIIILKDDVSPQEILKKYGVGKIHQYEHAFNGLAITASDNQISALKSDPRVAYIENDALVRASAQTIPPGIERIGATQSIDNTADFSDITIAILDTGIDLDHPDLNVDTALSKTFARGGQDANDKNGHGTHVAGTAAAINNGIGVVGVAQNATLIAVKVLGNGGSGSLSGIIAGIDYVKSLNDANSGTVDVINMSFGGSGLCGTSYQTAINSVNQGNVTVVVAAGNESDDAANHRPANCEGVITVSAIKDTDGLPGGTGGSGDDKFASFSNYGNKVKISAPGVSVLSTWKDGSYNTISGTSMASPHVAGAVAVIKHNSLTDLDFDAVLLELNNKGIEQTSDLTNENGIDCNSDPDIYPEKLVYLGIGNTTGTSCTNGGGGDPPTPDPDPTTSCTDPEIDYLLINVTMSLQTKGPWNHLLIPVHVSVNGTDVSDVCVDLNLSRAERDWDFLGTTDSSGDIVFKLSKARDTTFYTAVVVNQSHFLDSSDFTERCQIENRALSNCTDP